jgi:multidrug efflux system membrane fusion protein
MLNKRTLSLLLIISLLSACEKDKIVANKVYRPVQYIKVMHKSNQITDTFSGVIEADLDANLSFRVGGTIVNRSVKVGDLVQAGQLLAELDTTDLKVAYQQSLASLQQAKANERNQRASYERAMELYENNNSSKSELDNARAGADSAKAASNVASKQSEASRLQLSYSKLVSPQICSVAEILADTNEAVKAGYGVIRVTCGACAKVKVSVPGRLISSIHKGDDSIVRTSAFSDKEFPAKVTEVGVAASSDGTFPVEALLQGSCPDLRAGMSANLSFEFSDLEGSEQAKRLMVPYLSVGKDSKGNFVYILKPVKGGIYRAVRTSVEFEPRSNNGAEIITGIQAGDLVATAGVRRLLDGMEVKLLDTPIIANN